jgi:signal transduction histidine kinase
MNIRAKLTLIFFAVVIVVLTLICVSIYFFSENYRSEDFARRLKNRAINTAKVLTEVKEVNADLLKRMERNNPASLPNQFIAIYDDKNTLLYASDTQIPIAIDSALLSSIHRNEEIKYHERKFEVLGFLFAGRYEQFTIVAAATDVYGLEALNNLKKVLSITFAISIILVGLMGWFFSGRVLAPISKIVDRVSAISEVNLNERLDEGNKKDELSRLSQTFNKMLARLQAAFVSQKNFIANASHELKTPLTVMSTEIEVSLLQQREPSYYVNVLRSLLGNLKNLNKLSTQLLQLAHASADFPDKNFNQMRIDDILWEVKEELMHAYPEYVIDIDFDANIDTDRLIINGDEQLMKVAILNLVDNGCKFSNDHRLLVRLEADDRYTLKLRFINSGKGIEPEQIEKVFEPFYRGKSQQKVKGSGIGLSLVSRITHLHKGTITVHSVPNHMTEFQLKLPLN